MLKLSFELNDWLHSKEKKLIKFDILIIAPIYRNLNCTPSIYLSFLQIFQAPHLQGKSSR